MSYSELLQVIAASSLLTLAATLLLRNIWRLGRVWLQRFLRPRYLKSRRASRFLSAPHE